MAQLLVRKLDEKVVKKLKARARLHHRSLQAELKLILSEIAESGAVDAKNSLKELMRLRRKLRGRRFPETLQVLREERER